MMTSQLQDTNPVELNSIISVVDQTQNGGNSRSKMEVKSVVRVASNGSKKTKTSEKNTHSKVSKLSTEKPILLLPFGHQVSGRASILCYDETTLLKPYVSREVFFYQGVPHDLKQFTPQFRGLITVSFIEDGRSNNVLAYALPHTLEKPSSKSITKVYTEDAKPHSKRCVKDYGKTHVIYPSNTICKISQTVDINESDLFVGSGDFDHTMSQPSNNNELDEDDVVSELSQGFEMNVCINDKKPSLNDNELIFPSTGLHNPWNSKVLDDAWIKLKYHDTEPQSNGRKKKFTLLENVVAHYRRPCVLDLKIGTRVRENASPDKIARHVTAINLGARLSGMQIYHPGKQQFIYHNKYYGHNLTISGFKSNLRHFFSRGSIPIIGTSQGDMKSLENMTPGGDGNPPQIDRNLVKHAIKKLSKLRDAVGRIQSHRFYSSSVLLLYEGDDVTKMEEEENCDETMESSHTIENRHSPERLVGSSDKSFSFSEFLHRLKSSQQRYRQNQKQRNSSEIHDDTHHNKRSAHGHEYHGSSEHKKSHGNEESHDKDVPSEVHETPSSNDQQNDRHSKSREHQRHHSSHEPNGNEHRREHGSHKHQRGAGDHGSRDKETEQIPSSRGKEGHIHKSHSSYDHQRSHGHEVHHRNTSRRKHEKSSKDGLANEFQNKSWPRSSHDKRLEMHEKREDVKRRRQDLAEDRDFIDVRMIDFAHYCFHDNEMHPGPDGGFLFGLDNLINLLNDMLTS